MDLEEQETSKSWKTLIEVTTCPDCGTEWERVLTHACESERGE